VIVAWHEVPGTTPPQKSRPVGHGVIRAGVRLFWISCARSYRTLRDGSFDGRFPRHFRARLRSGCPGRAFRHFATGFSLASLAVAKLVLRGRQNLTTAEEVKRDAILTRPARVRLRPRNGSMWSRSPGYGWRYDRPLTGRNKRVLCPANLLFFRGTICDR
jgi:hypothetical protein